MNPELFAALVAALCLGFLVELIWVSRSLLRRKIRPLNGLGQGLFFLGLLIVGLGGMANWLFSLQGFMVLIEGDAIPLFGGRHLQAFEAGLLSDPAEMNLTVQLLDVELRPGLGTGFYPEMLLLVSRGPGQEQEISLIAGSSVASGSLWFHGGAFGFAPRILISRAGETLFDETVPFTTRRDDAQDIQFEGLFTIAAHELEVEGRVNLASWDTRVSGHPVLSLRISTNDELLGAGSLEVGGLAEVGEGLEIQFADLQMWAEIDVSRRNYPQPMFWGAVLAAAGIVLWVWAAAAHWIQRVRQRSA